MDRSRRVVTLEQTDGQSSDNEEVRIIGGNQPAKNKRVKKTVKKVKDKEEDELERTLRESGIDVTGMTKEEKQNIAQVIMMSKQEADERHKVEIDVGLHTDSEEEKQTTEAFIQAVHPDAQMVDLSEPENFSPLKNVKSGQSRDHLPDRYQQKLDEQPSASVSSPAANSSPDKMVKQSLFNSSQTSEAFEEAVHPRSTPEEEYMEEDPIPVTSENKKVMLNVKHQKHSRKQTKSNQEIKNQTKIDHFAHIVIPDDRKSRKQNQVEEELDALISDDDSSPERKKRMTESVIAADVENSTSHSERVPSTSHSERVPSTSHSERVPSTSHFEQVPSKLKNENKKLNELDLKELSDEDEHGGKSKKKINKKPGAADNLEHMISDDDENPLPSTSDAEKTFEPKWKDLMSGDESSPIKKQTRSAKMFEPKWKDLISEDDSSPIKKATGSGKKAFVWSEESDEETQDLFLDKKSFKVIDEKKDVGKKCQNQNLDDQDEEHNISGKNSQNHGSQKEVNIVHQEPFVPEEFYKFPPLHRHYRNVKKQKNEQIATLFPPLNTDPQAYTKALVQLFSLYHIRLAQLQKSSRHFLSWSKDPVKVGRHLDTTIDAKKRGLDYDFLENDDEVQLIDNSKSVVPAGVSNDVSNKQPLIVKPLAKSFNFKAKKDRNIAKDASTVIEEIDDFVESTTQLRSGRSRNVIKENSAVQDEDIDQYLDGFVSKPTRKGRTRNTATFSRQKSAEDFEPFPVNDSFKFSAEQGRKRKLYNENASPYCPIVEDDNSNDFDVGSHGNGNDFDVGNQGNKTTGRKIRVVILKKGDASSRGGKSETQQKRSRATTNNESKPATATRGSLKRMPSDLSTGSVESAKSEDLNNILDPVRPPSRSSDASLDGLSQSSDVLLDAQGQLYSTQFCAMQDKRAKTPTSKSNPTEAENEHLFQQYMSQQNDNEYSQQGTNRHFNTNSATQSFDNLSKASHETWSNMSSIFPQKSEKTRQNINDNDKKKENGQHSSSLKSRLFKTVGDLITLGSKKKTPVRKPEHVNIEVKSEDHGVHATGAADNEHLMDTQEFQLPGDTMADDIQQIHVNREPGEVRTYGRKQGRKRQLTENDDIEQNKVPKIMFPCPLCNKQFPQDQIETHAADCNGPDNGENDRSPPNEVQEIPGAVNIEPSSSGMQRQNRSRVTRKQDEDADFIIEDDESDKENPIKPDLTCYVCDKVCRNKKQYDQHVEKCLEEAKQIQLQVDTRGIEIVEEEEVEPTTPKRTTRSAKASINSPEGYSSGSENEKMTLRDIVNGHSSGSSVESSYSDEYDWSPSKTPPDYKPVNKENVLPGGWTLEELTNSPIRSYVPISKQNDNEGFKAQFDKAKERYQRQLLKGKGKRKPRGKKRRRKRKTKNKCAAKRTRLE